MGPTLPSPFQKIQLGPPQTLLSNTGLHSSVLQEFRGTRPKPLPAWLPGVLEPTNVDLYASHVFISPLPRTALLCATLGYTVPLRQRRQPYHIRTLLSHGPKPGSAAGQGHSQEPHSSWKKLNMERPNRRVHRCHSQLDTRGCYTYASNRCRCSGDRSTSKV
jgi:hypothetical protein